MTIKIPRGFQGSKAKDPGDFFFRRRRAPASIQSARRVDLALRLVVLAGSLL